VIGRNIAALTAAVSLSGGGWTPYAMQSVVGVTRSQAVASIADRTASQQTN